MTNKHECSNSSTNRIKSVIQSKRKLYFRELSKEANVTTELLEDFLIPLLEEGKIEGKIELRCPDCGADLGRFDKYTDVPKETDCEYCGHTVPLSDNYLEILLEVKGDFFRGQL